jgi:hypothetical protein
VANSEGLSVALPDGATAEETAGAGLLSGISLSIVAVTELLIFSAAIGGAVDAADGGVDAFALTIFAFVSL